jgi:hypothetical protein
MKHRIPYLLILVATLLSACASQTPKQPDWISGDSATYKSSQYLLGRGQAGTADEAQDRARADLAKIFQVAVTVDSSDVQQFKSGDAGGTGEYQSQASRRITTRTEQIVRGIQIAQLWQDPVTLNHHALAVLPRLQAAAGLRQQISQLDEATRKYIDQSRGSSDLLLKIAAANHALESQQERAALQKSLQVVDVTGRGIDSPWNSAALQSDLESLLKRVRIASQTTADSPPGLAQVVSGALAQAGFLIETGQDPDFVLQGRLNLADLGMQQGWYWQRGTLEVSLSEKTGGRVRGTRSWPIKSSAQDRDGAARRALTQAETVLKQELRSAVIDMATGRAATP